MGITFRTFTRGEERHNHRQTGTKRAKKKSHGRNTTRISQKVVIIQHRLLMANLELTHTHDPCLQKSLHEESFKLLALILKKKKKLQTGCSRAWKKPQF